MVEQLVEEIGRPVLGGDYSQVDGAVAQAALRAINRRARRKSRTPSPARVGRIAREVDEFVTTLGPAAESLRDSELLHLADVSMSWAPELRSGARKLDAVYFDVKLVLGQLRREQTRLSLELMREN